MNDVITNAGDFEEQSSIDMETECGLFRMLREDARHERESLEINRWWAQQERRYTAYLLERVAQTIARARGNLEVAKAHHAQALALRRRPPPRAENDSVWAELKAA